MVKPPDTGIIRPFLAPLLLKRNPNTSVDKFMSALCREVEAIVASDNCNGPTETSNAAAAGGLRVRTIEFVEVRSPAWAPASWRMDVQHHLIVVATKGDLAAVCVSQSGLVSKLAGVGCASLIDRAALERAFVGSRASVIWMSGIHEVSDAKPSAKTLMGSALEYALDPLGDQSFHYSAMRSSVGIRLDGKKDASIGASPRSSRIWVNRPPNWTSFVGRLEMLIDRIAAPPPPSGRFSMLAQSLSDLGGVTGAYEVGFVPPEMFTDATDPEPVEEMEAWAFETEFEILGARAADCDVKVVHKGVDLGDVAVRPSMTEGRVAIDANWTQVRDGTPTEHEQCISHLRDVHWTKIRYASGHVLSQAGCYTSAYRDQRFDWRFVDLADYVVTKEKPTVGVGQTLAARIGSKAHGAIDDSLFGYVFDLLGGEGWLASDDGSMEIADFIHIADDDRVTLVHVKAASSASVGRQTSASKYEVVVGQAIKNLRHLDRTTLAASLTRNQDNQIGSAVWNAGATQPDRTGLIRRASQLSPGYSRRVVILHPQLTRAELNACNAGTATADRLLRMKQLHTLMLGARLSAGAVGASLEGWGAA